MTDEQAVERGRLARDVMENPVYVEAFSKVQEEIFSKWQTSKSPDEAEQLRSLSKSMMLFRSKLEAVMRNGEVSQERLNVLQRAIGKLRGGD